MKTQESHTLDDIQKLHDRLVEYNIGDPVCIVGGMGDWDEGFIVGVRFTVEYEVLTEYGNTWVVDGTRLYRCKHEEKE